MILSIVPALVFVNPYLLPALLLLAAGCGKTEATHTASTPAEPANAAAPTLDSFERRVMMDLDALVKRPAAAAFAADLAAAPDLRKALESGPAPAEISRFKELVKRHSADAKFRRAVESPAEEDSPAAPEDCEDPAAKALLEVVHSRYWPNKVLAGIDPAADEAPGEAIPLLEGREAIDGRPTAYVCRNYACQMPVTEPEALRAQLESRA